MGEELLTPKEVAAILRLSASTVGDKLRAGVLPGLHLGHVWRVRAADLDAYIVRMSEDAAAKRDAATKTTKPKAKGGS